MNLYEVKYTLANEGGGAHTVVDFVVAGCLADIEEAIAKHHFRRSLDEVTIYSTRCAARDIIIAPK